MKGYAINQFIMSPCIAATEAYFGHPQFRRDLESFPSLFEILGQLIYFMLLEDFFFYWSHRFLHTPYIYKKIHKKHHEYHQTISIAAVYTHPLEYLFGNILPLAVGYISLKDKCHFATIVIW